MKVLVTGGLGHIGSRLIRTGDFRKSAANLTVVDNFASERFCSLFNISPKTLLNFSRLDVRDLSADAIHDTDVVVHLAAQTDATSSLEQREAVFANNLAGTAHMAHLAEITGARFVFASTTSVYGSQASRVDETSENLLPQSPYAECKMQEEQLVQEGIQRGLDAIILRLGTIAGPSPGMRFHTAVNKFCLQARLGEPLSVWRTAWQQVRPYLDVDDAVRAISWASTVNLPDGAPSNRVFNVVTENLTVQQIVGFIEGHFGPTHIAWTDNRIMNQLSYEVSSDRLADHGFVSSGSISDAIRRTAELLAGVASTQEGQVPHVSSS